MSYQSVNPATGKVLKKFKEITNKQLETSLKTAATCFETWRFKTFAERARGGRQSGRYFAGAGG